MNSELYNQAYYHAVRRAMLENETALKRFMEFSAIHYSDEKLKKLDDLLIRIDDNSLFNLLTGNIAIDSFSEQDRDILLEIIDSNKNI